MLKSLFKDTRAPNIDNIHHSQNSYFNASVTQELFKATLIALKSCLNMPVSVATCERTFTALRRLEHIFDQRWREETYSLCSPSRLQWQSRQFGFFSVWKTSCWKMRKEQKSLAIPTVYSPTVDIKETRITKSVLVLQDSTENWLNCRALFHWQLCVKFLSLWL